LPFSLSGNLLTTVIVWLIKRWTDSETLLFAEAFHNISKDFKSIAEYIGTKNQFQCKEYYHYYRSRLGLDDAADKTARRVRSSSLEVRAVNINRLRLFQQTTKNDRPLRRKR